MSGHSKWATIKRAKAAIDAKRGAVFTKLGNLITIAAREKGGDPVANFSLRMAMDKARAVNMPKENIERAIKRGTGELAGGQIEEIFYEGIGPANSQFIVKVLTDNKNRSAAEVRHVFTKNGGSLGNVMWNFSQRGVLRINNEKLKMNNVDLDEFELDLIEAGADDILKEEEGITIYTKAEDLQGVKKFLDNKEIKTESAEIEYVAKDELGVDGENASADKERIEKFIEELEGLDEVADCYTNVNM